MQKLILISLLVANVVIPVWGAREPNARRGLRKTVRGLLLFDLAYLIALCLLYPRL
jgi:hypothetical protein